MYVFIHEYVNIQSFIFKPSSYVRIYSCIHILNHLDIFIFTYTLIHSHRYIYIYIIYIYIYIYIIDTFKVIIETLFDLISLIYYETLQE